jgi:hypothetical protein
MKKKDNSRIGDCLWYAEQERAHHFDTLETKLLKSHYTLVTLS